MAEVVGSEEFEEWFQALDDADTDAVARVVDMLEMQGPTLPFPYSSSIKGSRLALRELRMIPRAEAIFSRYLQELES
jgi:hypothetical protein